MIIETNPIHSIAINLLGEPIISGSYFLSQQSIIWRIDFQFNIMLPAPFYDIQKFNGFIPCIFLKIAFLSSRWNIHEDGFAPNGREKKEDYQKSCSEDHF